MNPTRRSLLGGAGLLAASTFAGCLDDLGLDDREYDTGYGAPFALYDWADQVSGDVMEFENPVDTGESGHGWNPPGDLTRDVADAGVFVYLDTPEFSWAQDIATTLEADYDDVIVVDGFEGLDDQLLEWDHEVEGGDHDGHDHDDEHEGDDDSHDHDHDGDHDEHDHDEDGHDDEGHDHDHGDGDGDRASVDPHAWLDPHIAEEMVANVADGLAEAHPDEEETFQTNAEEYVAVLEEIDAQFEDLMADADRTTAVLVGHDSFTYLEERYGFELHTPIGVSPNEGVTSSAIAETVEFIDEEGFDTILYEAFEAPEDEYPDAVETILDDSNASDAMPLSPVSGTLASWQDEGWGYREQMEEINVPAFREALDAQ